MSVSQSILERIYVQTESTFGVAPNSSGTATLAGGDYMRHTKATLLPKQEIIPSSDKTGSISATVGANGARSGTWSLDFEARPSGAAGTAPDCDPLLQAAFGAAPTVVSSTSVQYNLANAIKSFTMYRYRQPSTINQYYGVGCVVREMQFQFAQNANCKFVMSGTSLFVPDSKNFSALDSTGKGGLTTMPSEPGSPTYAGSPVNGLSGSATIDGNTDILVRSATIRMQTAIEIPNDRLFGGQYGSAPERDILGVFLDMSIFDDDGSSVTALYTKALAGTPIDISFVAGSVAGSRIQFFLNDCQLPMPEADDSPRKWAQNLNNIRAYASSSTALDEFYVKFY
jgi:hypothetical protein